MDAVKFLKEAKRMCKSYEHCTDCPFESYDCSLGAIENPQIEVEIWEDCEVIGNIFDNPELLKPDTPTKD